MAQAQFPEPKDLDLPFDKKVGDGTSYAVGNYNVSNPHPGFGKDPNIINEYGHTLYPKFIKNADGVDVIVNSPEEEAATVAPAADEEETKEEAPKKTGW